MFTYSKLFVCAAAGTLLWWMPAPAGLSPEAWQLFALFVATIAAIIAKAAPIGALCILALSTSALTGLLSIQQALSGFGKPVIWLIVLAFLIARAFIKTGLGRRIAYLLVYALGKNTLGLAYGLILGDLALAPAIPSNTARAGGILYPIAQALAHAFDSRAEDGTAKRLGTFLMLCVFHGNVVTSAMFLTAMAANPLVAHFASLQDIDISWTQWAIAASVPGALSLLLTPLLLWRLAPPEQKRTPDAPLFAQRELAALGPTSVGEKKLLGVFAFLLVGWIAPSLLGDASATTIALTGLAALLFLGVLDWEDVKRERGAWDTLVWFAVLVTFAGHLDAFGFTRYLGAQMGGLLSGLSGYLAVVVVVLTYVLVHYVFASSTAQVSALYGTFLALGLSLGAAPLPLALMLGFASNLYGGLTHYSIGHAPVFFGAGYAAIGTWWRIGGLMTVAHVAIWLSVGGAWMALLGY